MRPPFLRYSFAVLAFPFSSLFVKRGDHYPDPFFATLQILLSPFCATKVEVFSFFFFLSWTQRVASETLPFLFFFCRKRRELRPLLVVPCFFCNLPSLFPSRSPLFRPKQIWNLPSPLRLAISKSYFLHLAQDLVCTSHLESSLSKKKRSAKNGMKTSFCFFLTFFVRVSSSPLY